MKSKAAMDIDAEVILTTLGEAEESDRKSNPGPLPREFDPYDVQEATELTSQALNDAIELLEENGHVELRSQVGLGDSPFKFTGVLLTVMGRQEYQRLTAQTPK